MAKTAVVLFNLGGPDRPQSVRPFLFNLFNDPAIIGLPFPIRWMVAQFIAARRAPIARQIYAHMGGGSPLLNNTRAQAQALQQTLNRSGARIYQVFIAMRYWEPMSRETAADVKRFDPDRIVLLPLYPQFSATTTGSSLDTWRKAAKSVSLEAGTRVLCCYPTAPGFIAAIAGKLRTALADLRASGHNARVLFSAHGLPKRLVAAGDPYQWQVERSVAAVVSSLNVPGLEHVICYQSRVGPLEWLGPSTDEEIARCGRDRRAAVVVPIAFVSEHSETLVELDIEYRKLAEEAGVPRYIRVGTAGDDPAFIEALATLVQQAEATGVAICRRPGEAACPDNFRRCPHIG
ncbi:MAG: ferrochelatase [Alphaproteobacteria bacterium]